MTVKWILPYKKIEYAVPYCCMLLLLSLNPSDYGTIPRQANGHGINSDTATSEIGEDAPVINVNVKNKSHYRRT